MAIIPNHILFVRRRKHRTVAFLTPLTLIVEVTGQSQCVEDKMHSFLPAYNQCDSEMEVSMSALPSASERLNLELIHSSMLSFQGHMNSSEQLHIVLGNEACDIDSMVSALTFAYFLSKVRTPVIYTVPCFSFTCQFYQSWFGMLGISILIAKS